MDKQTAQALQAAADMASAAAAAAAPSSVGGIAATLTAMVLKAAAGAAAAGRDPVTHVQRLLDADTVLQPIREEFERKIRESFGGADASGKPEDPPAEESEEGPYAWRR
jgi:hypothetical protein